MTHPFVSICTVTYNRRHFIPLLIKCIEHQTYPHDKIEWIIIDDGTDPIDDLINNVPIYQVKYFRYDTKMPLGEKRNLMNQKCSGDIIIYMDDDDYYPPSRVSHAVESLQSNPQMLVAGCSEMHMWYDKKMYKCGPYGKFHSTAATLAFKKQLLETHRYENKRNFTEEPDFLKKYTTPLIQLDTLKTILVIAHEQNTLDKKCLIDNQREHGVTESPFTIDSFVGAHELKNAYLLNVHHLIKNYEMGNIKHKPDVERDLNERNTAKLARQLVVANEEQKSIIKRHEKMLKDQTITIQAQMKEIRLLKQGNLKK
jgi:glycosyltransferase involved in cell wall biosynthesis